MTVLAYSEAGGILPADIVGYPHYTGQVDLLFSDSAEIDIGQILYDEFLTLPPVSVSAWGYAYIWKAALFQAPVTSDLVSSFASIPNRYKLGHLCVTSTSGVAWDDVLRFEDQLTPLFRGSFFTDNPQPGDGFPFGTTPLGKSAMSFWRTTSGYAAPPLYTHSKGTFLNVFLRTPSDYVVRILYNGFLSFTSFDIIAASPNPFVVVYP